MKDYSNQKKDLHPGPEGFISGCLELEAEFPVFIGPNVCLYLSYDLVVGFFNKLKIAMSFLVELGICDFSHDPVSIRQCETDRVLYNIVELK